VANSHPSARRAPILTPLSLSQCCFLLAAAGSMAYYAMWSGLGVSYKDIDTTPRVIFLGRYIGHLITMPVRAHAQLNQCYACAGTSFEADHR